MGKKFEDLIKEIRLNNNENMADMAEWLGVSLPFVSAVENGKKKIPESWFEKISQHYDLSKKQKKELEDSILETQSQIKLDLSNLNENQRKMTIQFQRSFEKIDDETAKKIYKILGGK